MVKYRNILLACTACIAAGLPVAAQPAAAQEVKIGFLSTFTGPAAAIGQEQKNGFELGLEHRGNKLGGLTPRVLIGDDQLKSEIALSVVDKWMSQDKVDFVVGPIWSNVILSIKDTVFQNGKILISMNAGPNQLAGEQCNPLAFSTSWNNEAWAEAAAEMANADGIKNIFVLLPNYQSGKDLLTAFQRHYKGTIVSTLMFKLNTMDFQAELSEIRAKKPDAVFAFAPAGMGIALFKQWQAAGLSKDVKLLSVGTVDYLTVKGMGEGVVGTYFPSPFDQDSKLPVARKFVTDFIAKHKRPPSYYAAQSYDATILIDHGIKAVKGDLTKVKDMVLAMRGMRVEWTRGPVTFNTNHIPITNWYKQTVLWKDGAPEIKTESVVLQGRKDAYYEKCKMPY